MGRPAIHHRQQSFHALAKWTLVVQLVEAARAEEASHSSQSLLPSSIALLPSPTSVIGPIQCFSSWEMVKKTKGVTVLASSPRWGHHTDITYTVCVCVCVLLTRLQDVGRHLTESREELGIDEIGTTPKFGPVFLR
jgi:hypothetical protein